MMGNLFSWLKVKAVVSITFNPFLRTSSKEIKSKADKESSIIVAEARKKAEEIRGEGEAKALQIYSDAYSQDVEFYEFWRKLTSYRKSFPGGKTTILVTPDSEYLKLLSEGVTKDMKLKEEKTN